MGQYRSRLQIIADILTVVRSGARKTRVMYQANLSYRLLNQYLGFALETDLISVDNGNYIVTPKGFDFLEKFRKYSQRNEHLKEQLQTVANEKEVLEKNYVVRSANSESPNPVAKRSKSVESSA